MLTKSEWLLTSASLPAGFCVAAEPEKEWTHLELTPTREIVAWWISLAITPGHSLFLMRDCVPHTPPMPFPGATYNPREDRDLLAFLSRAYEGIEHWTGRESDPRVAACIRALQDPGCCQAAWPSPTRIIEVEMEFLRLVESEIEKGASPMRLVREVMAKYHLTPIQAREAINPVLMELLDNNAWSPGRRNALLEIAYSSDVREGVESQDRRLAVAARTNQARVHGLITYKAETTDKDDLARSIIDAMARVGKENPLTLPEADQ